MKAYQLQNTFGIDNVTLVDRPEPKPGPGQVVLKMLAFSLNYRDLMVVKGLYNPKLRFPLVPLSDGVGEVVAVGGGVSRVKVGDRVCPLFMQQWVAGAVTDAAAKSALGAALDGVLAEYTVFHEDGVTAVPKHLTDPEAATLPCAAVTAWHALITEGKAGPGRYGPSARHWRCFALCFAVRPAHGGARHCHIEQCSQAGARPHVGGCRGH